MAQFNERFNGIIMYRRDYRERDLLVKILTDRVGKTMFLVKNAKKRGFRLTADILPFTHGTYIGVLNQQGLSFMNAAADTQQYQTITQDIVKNAYATYILGLLDSAFQDDQPLGSWFDKISAALRLIDEGADEAIIANIIEVQLLDAFGVAPQWQGCAVCGRDDLAFDYSERYGGLLCTNHFHLDDHRLHLDQRTIYYLRQFSVLKLTQLNSINVHEATKKHLRAVLDQIYDNSVGLHLKSKRFIDQMSMWTQKLTQHTSNDIDNDK